MRRSFLWPKTAPLWRHTGPKLEVKAYKDHSEENTANSTPQVTCVWSIMTLWGLTSRCMTPFAWANESATSSCKTMLVIKKDHFHHNQSWLNTPSTVPHECSSVYHCPIVSDKGFWNLYLPHARTQEREFYCSDLEPANNSIAKFRNSPSAAGWLL